MPGWRTVALSAILIGAFLGKFHWDVDTSASLKVPPWPFFLAGKVLLRWLPVLQTRLLPPQIAVLQLSASFMQTQALYTVTKLGVAEALVGGPLAVEDLATAVGAKPDNLRRLLRLLVASGIFREPRPGVFDNNRASGVLRRDHPSSVASLVQHNGGEAYWGHSKMYEAALSSSSDTSFGIVSGGLQFWKWLELPENKEISDRFDQAMVDGAVWTNPPLLLDYEWSQHGNQTVADVGGGVGGVLGALLKKHPGMHGILFDRPPVIERAKALWQKDHPDLVSRVEFLPGNFFESLPKADVFLLSHILHDWDDTSSIEILQTLWQAAHGQARLLIADVVMPERQPMGLAPALLDIQMLSLVGGKERTEGEWRALLEAGGFELERIVPLRSVQSIVVGRPRAA